MKYFEEIKPSLSFMSVVSYHKYTSDSTQAFYSISSYKYISRVTDQQIVV